MTTADLLAAVVRSLRCVHGLSQKGLAQRMRVPRQYLSKIENCRLMPTIAGLERLARSLEVTVPDLFDGNAPTRQLVENDFVSALLPFVPTLDAQQRQSIIAWLIKMHEVFAVN